MSENIDLFLTFNTRSDLISDKLPSKLEVLQYLFHCTKNVKMNLHDSAVSATVQVANIWNNVGIPIRRSDKIVEKLKALHEEWRSYQKSPNKMGQNMAVKFAVFSTELENLFDIAAVDAVNQIDMARQQFLKNQRQAGRIGSIHSFMETLQEHSASAVSTVTKSMSSLSTQNTETEYVCSHSVGTSSQQITSPDASPPIKRSRGTKEICTSRVAVALDVCKVSDRNAVRLLTAVLDALDLDIDDYKVSRTYIREKRIRLREEMFNHVKAEFDTEQLTNIILHWDGKILADITGQEKMDRLPIVLSSDGITKLLAVPKLDSSTGKAQAEAIFDTLKEWGVSDKIKGLCCDTTASNLGHLSGAAVLLEILLERKIQYFPCRHHILELLLRAAFEELIPGTVGPSVPLFQRFKNNWSDINHVEFEFGVSDLSVKAALQNDLEQIELIIKKHLTFNFDREDYKELLELSLLFIGVKPSDSYSIKKPGPMHHARWLSKALYSLKIFLFRKVFSLSKKDTEALKMICIFIVKIYIKHWFDADLPDKAPNNDLMLLKECDEFAAINKNISVVTVKKIARNLWYLSPDNVSMAFFDDDVSVDVKRKMISKLNVTEDDYEDIKKAVIDLSNVRNISLEQFVTSESCNFFKNFDLSTEWLKDDPNVWNLNSVYLKAQNTVRLIKVVNDLAERSVQVFEKHSGLLTKNEEQLQYILQCVEYYHKTYPSYHKCDLKLRV